MLTTYLTGISFVFLLALSIKCISIVVKQIPPFVLAQLEVIIAILFISTWLLIFEHITLVELFILPTYVNWFWLSFSGILLFLAGNYFSIKNLKQTNSSNNSLLSPIITVLVSLFAFIFLDARLSFINFLGLFITVSAVVLYQVFENNNINFNTGFKFGWLSALFTSLNIICAIKGATNSNVSLMHNMFLRLFAVFIFIFFLGVFSKQSIYKYLKLASLKTIFFLITAILLQTIIGTYLWFYASLSLGVPKFQVLIALLPFVMVLLEIIASKSFKIQQQFYLTALLAFVGVMLVFWQDLIF
jgi:drug/metabolite transporter (DMT)-like permease